MARSKRQPGEVNRNDQRLVERTDQAGTDHNQFIWILECMRPDHPAKVGRRYGANGSDFHLRKCPVCDGGAAGLSYVENLNA